MGLLYSVLKLCNRTAKANLDNYKKEFANNGFTVDEETLQESQRCTSETCCFIREKLGINIKSANSKHSNPPMFITDKNKIIRIWNDNEIPKLFYWKHREYICENSMNWGESKGLTKKDVCVILTDTLSKTFKKDSWEKMAPKTKGSFYVACTRASGQVYFIEQKSIANYKRT